MSELFAPSSISVSELNALAKALLEDHLAGLWIAGEVSNLTRAASGHYYFLAQRQPRAGALRHVQGCGGAFGETFERRRPYRSGGKISIYEARGEFQITVNEVRLKGLGQLYEAYERLKAQLQAKARFQRNAKSRCLPVRNVSASSPA